MSNGNDLKHVLNERQVKRLTQWTPTRQRMLQRLWSGGGTRSLAIRMFCLECVGEDVPAITGCTADTCPLWNFRPFQPKPKKG